MDPFEMLWSLGCIIVALVIAEWYFIGRSTKKAIKVIRAEFPLIEKFTAILKEPDFIDVICDTLDTLDTVNKAVKFALDVAREVAPAFCAPEIYDSFLNKIKTKGDGKYGKRVGPNTGRNSGVKETPT